MRIRMQTGGPTTLFVALLFCACSGGQESAPDGGKLDADAGLADDAGTACAGTGDRCLSTECCKEMFCNPDTLRCARIIIDRCGPAPAFASCCATGADCEVDEDCCQGSDASKGAWCDEEGTCKACSQKDEPCDTDYDCCPSASPLMCTSARVCVPICESDFHCAGTISGDCGDPDVCMPNGECMPPSCSSDELCCGGGSHCCSGECKSDCGYGEPTACTITTPGGPIFPGKTLALHAIAWNGDPSTGGQIVPWTMFTWSSSNAAAVAVDAATGELTGRQESGTAEINAKVGDVDCGTVSFTNYLPPDGGTVRVVVYDERTGTPIENAVVVVGPATLGATDATGTIAGFAAPGDVHVFHRDYTYVSVVGTTKNDLVIHLRNKPDTTKSGGFKGEFDYSQVKDKGVQLGFAGVSFTGNMLDFDFGSFKGDTIRRHVKLETAKGAPTDYDDAVALPGTFVFKAEQFGAPDLLPGYRVLGEPGLRVAWGIGGGLPSRDITRLLQLLSPIISGGGIIDSPPGPIIGAIVQLFSKFSSAVTSVFMVAPMPKVGTPCIDRVTGDLDPDVAYPCKALGKDLLPLVDSPTMADYDSFPELTLKLTTKMALKTTLSLPLLPKLKGRFLGRLTAIGGVQIPGLGMVPLGMTAGFDSLDDPSVEGDGKVNAPAPADNPDGIVDGQLQLRMSPNHTGTEGNPYVIVLLVTDDGVLCGGAAKELSAKILKTDSLHSSLDLTSDRFLGFPEGTVYDNATRTIAGPASPVESAELYQYTLSGENGDWQIYTEGNLPAIVLPSSPDGMDDRSANAVMSVQVARLTETTLGALTSSDSGRHLNNLNEVIDAFSRLTCLKKIPTDNPDYAAKCQPTDPTRVDEACNPACEVR